MRYHRRISKAKGDVKVEFEWDLINPPLVTPPPKNINTPTQIARRRAKK